MTQMNLSTKQKQTHRHREQTCDCQGGGEEGGGWTGTLGFNNVLSSRVPRPKMPCDRKRERDSSSHRSGTSYSHILENMNLFFWDSHASLQAN